MAGTMPRLVNEHIAAGSLPGLVRERTRAALETGALVPLATTSRLVASPRFDFVVRTVTSLERKRAARRPGVKGGNPFLPHDPELFVTDLSTTHHALLNKFNVLDLHLLIVTRDFESQERLLTRADFEALAVCLVEYEGLGFYNGGVEAGASQEHKHLQYVPLPLAEVGEPVPIETPLLASLAGGRLQWSGLFPWQHRVVLLALSGYRDSGKLADALFTRYLDMASALGIRGTGPAQCRPYNLLVTRRWMLIVPRSREMVGGISVNALAFAGTFLVADGGQLEELLRLGPMAALQSVAAKRE